MGASGSKECSGAGPVGQSSASDLNPKKHGMNMFSGSSVFGSSCIRLACRSADSADSIQIHRKKEKNHDTRFVGSEIPHENTLCSRKVGAEQSFGSGVEDGAKSRDPNNSDACNQSANHSRSLLSRFNLFPSSLSFRMGRELGTGSSRDNTSRTEFPNMGEDGEIHEDNESSAVRPSGCVNIPELGSYSNRQVVESTRDIAGSDRPRDDISVPTATSTVNVDIIPPQPTDHNVRFSRSLSVGRLRDRVLRRSSASEPTVLPVQQDEDVMNISSNRISIDAPYRGNSDNPSDALFVSPQSNTRSVVARTHDHIPDSSLPRETRHHDVLEHRSNFLERRRRIRSQVRALQRLGNRFENFSGHERSCIMSGHLRTGSCTCRPGTRVGNSNDDSTARGSISRIVILAEALFEVLDEMHQQSVVLSSQPSISSIGSVPAPSEIVESLPIKLHSKLQMHLSDDVAQCYVCLLEYEEGDKIRVLPCHHEFHKTCIDKWLKEIHRVCPLCRGDICRSGTSHLESQI